MPKNLNITPRELKAKGSIKFTDIPVNAYSKSVSDMRSEYGDGNLLRIYRGVSEIILETLFA